MSLLQEAHNNLQRQRQREENFRTQKREWPQQKHLQRERKRLEKQEVEVLCQELRSESERLLTQYGTDAPTSMRDKTITTISKLTTVPEAIIFDRTLPFKRKELVTKLNGEEGEEVEINISSSYIDPTKGSIRINVQTLQYYLELQGKKGKGVIKRDGFPYGFLINAFDRNATREDVKGYRKVIAQIGEKLEPPSEATQGQIF